jgi:hypothetical protein
MPAQVCKDWSRVVKEHMDISGIVAWEGRQRFALKQRRDVREALRKVQQEEGRAAAAALAGPAPAPAPVPKAPPRMRAGWLACAGRSPGG